MRIEVSRSAEILLSEQEWEIVDRLIRAVGAAPYDINCKHGTQQPWTCAKDLAQKVRQELQNFHRRSE